MMKKNYGLFMIALVVGLWYPSGLVMSADQQTGMPTLPVGRTASGQTAAQLLSGSITVDSRKLLHACNELRASWNAGNSLCDPGCRIQNALGVLRETTAKMIQAIAGLMQRYPWTIVDWKLRWESLTALSKTFPSCVKLLRKVHIDTMAEEIKQLGFRLSTSIASESSQIAPKSS